MKSEIEITNFLRPSPLAGGTCHISVGVGAINLII